MKDIDFLLKDLLKPILKGYSPLLLILKKNWLNIIGEKYYEFCEVDKVIFPKNKKNDGILYIICFNNIISFYIENNKIFVIEKINAMFGYNLIQDIKIKQKPKFIKSNNIKKSKTITQNEENILVDATINIENDSLKESLKNLGKIIYLNDK